MTPFERYVLRVADQLVDVHDLHPDDAAELMDIYRKDVVRWEVRRIPVPVAADALMERMHKLVALTPNPRPTTRPPAMVQSERQRALDALERAFGGTEFRLEARGQTVNGFAFSARSFSPRRDLVAYVSSAEVRIWDREARRWVNPLLGSAEFESGFVLVSLAVIIGGFGYLIAKGISKGVTQSVQKGLTTPPASGTSV